MLSSVEMSSSIDTSSSIKMSSSGIKKPNHRKKLKQSAEELGVGDGLPVRVPGSVQEFLDLLRLPEYLQTLLNQVQLCACCRAHYELID